MTKVPSVGRVADSHRALFKRSLSGESKLTAGDSKRSDTSRRSGGSSSDSAHSQRSLRSLFGTSRRSGHSRKQGSSVASSTRSTASGASSRSAADPLPGSITRHLPTDGDQALQWCLSHCKDARDFRPDANAIYGRIVRLLVTSKKHKVRYRVAEHLPARDGMGVWGQRLLL